MTKLTDFYTHKAAIIEAKRKKLKKAHPKRAGLREAG